MLIQYQFWKSGHRESILFSLVHRLAMLLAAFVCKNQKQKHGKVKV